MAENTHTGKWQKIHTLTMTEWKMHNTENGIKYIDWKMAENAHLDNDRVINAQHGKWQNRKCRTQ